MKFIYDIKIKQYNTKDDLLFNISTLQFEKLSNNLINRIEKILQDINDNYKSIKYIIMVGNTSKIKIIFQLYNTRYDSRVKEI